MIQRNRSAGLAGGLTRTLTVVAVVTALAAAVLAIAAATGFPVPQRAEAGNGPISQVDPSTLVCDGNITFDDVAGGAAPGTNYDAVFESDGADFAERFAGQTLSANGDFDVLSGTPSDPLSLQLGAANQNLNVFVNGPSQVLAGLGPAGFPNFEAVGEGAFAVLFDFDQSEFGFDLVGGGAGDATVDFFARDGTLIDSIVLSGLSDQSYGFQRAGGANDIAGISVQNSDDGGVGFDNLCHDVAGVVGQPTPTPTPTPEPTAAPTATPEPTATATPTATPAAAAPSQLPDTGSPPGQSGFPWLAMMVAGLMAMGAGGVWLRRARR
ncbi:MAG: LPXTG cell wall anchor domain-containing protein [Dehalococcoidia bacterium]